MCKSASTVAIARVVFLEQGNSDVDLKGHGPCLPIQARGVEAVAVFAPTLAEMLARVAANKENDSVLIGYAAIFARIIVQYPAALPHVLASSPLGKAFHWASIGCCRGRVTHCECCVIAVRWPTGGQALTILIGCWLDKIDAAADERHRKLYGLALAALLGMDDVSGRRSSFKALACADWQSVTCTNRATRACGDAVFPIGRRRMRDNLQLNHV
jgi:hypothetical protein